MVRFTKSALRVRNCCQLFLSLCLLENPSFHVLVSLPHTFIFNLHRPVAGVKAQDITERSRFEDLCGCNSSYTHSLKAIKPHVEVQCDARLSVSFVDNICYPYKGFA